MLITEIAGLVIGIIILAVCFILLLDWLGSLCGLLAIIFGVISVKNGVGNKGKAKAAFNFRNYIWKIYISVY